MSCRAIGLVPSGVSRTTDAITTTSDSTGAVFSAPRIQTLVALLNGLPASQRGVGRCAKDSGLSVRFAFYSYGQAVTV